MLARQHIPAGKNGIIFAIMNEVKGQVFSIAAENAPVRAYVDQELCIGCGLCTSIAPDVFAMNAHGKAEAVSDTTDANGESAKQAIEGCPVAAIRETI